ncbi:MAG: hypothetical protein V4507_10380 [Verrucomicrobiota bacterium]
MGGSLNLDQREAIASAWTRQGIDYLHQPQGASLSIPWFEAAINLRSHFPLDQNRGYRYGLAAGWMNRGEALAQLGGEENLKESIRSFDHAIEQLPYLPVEERIEFRQRHIIAWSNRGITLLQQGQNLNEAVRSFQNAHSFLFEELPDFFFLKIGIETNLATAQFQSSGDQYQAETQARAILLFVEPYESTDFRLTEISLKARHLFCLSIGYQADSQRHTSPISSDRISEVTDVLEKGIHLALHWKNQGNDSFLPWAQTLFCFGLQFYRVYLPQFLAEFVTEFLKEEALPGSPSLDQLILESLRMAESTLYHQSSQKNLAAENIASTQSLIERYHDLALVRKQYEVKIGLFP